jgi:hypothetical protein
MTLVMGLGAGAFVGDLVTSRVCRILVMGLGAAH